MLSGAIYAGDTRLSAAAQLVEIQADWLTYATAVATVLAAVLALASVLYSARQARRAERMLLRERRADFELGLLAEMRRQLGVTGTKHLDGYIAALIRPGADDADIPLLRSELNWHPVQAPQGQRLADLETQGRRALQTAMAVEIQEAIERRLVDLG